MTITPAEAARNLLTCPHCVVGQVPALSMTLLGDPAWTTCRECGGSGRRRLYACTRCDDTGFVDVADPVYGITPCSCELGTRARAALEAIEAERYAAERAARDEPDPLDQLPF